MIVIGLGNPGKEYEKARHNAGFMALDLFAKEHSFPPFQLVKKHNALVSEESYKGVLTLLVKPQTFMNNSGKAVQSIVKSSPSQILVVIHDDIDILLGKMKVSEGRGSAGHKGVESIMQELETKNFTRIRIGIQPQKGKPTNSEKFVLQKFSPQELLLLKQSLADTSHWLLSFIKSQAIA